MLGPARWRRLLEQDRGGHGRDRREAARLRRGLSQGQERLSEGPLPGGSEIRPCLHGRGAQADRAAALGRGAHRHCLRRRDRAPARVRQHPAPRRAPRLPPLGLSADAKDEFLRNEPNLLRVTPISIARAPAEASAIDWRISDELMGYEKAVAEME